MPSYHTEKVRVKIQEYIESGIIESYALGLASSQEASQFEQLLPLHPELKDALSAFEFQLELFALKNEVPPPPGIREKIEERLRDLPAVKRVHRQNGGNGQHEKDPASEYVPVRDSSPHIRVHKYWRPVFILIFILSKIFLILFLYYFFQNRYAQKEIRQLEEKLTKAAGSTTAPVK